MLLRSFAVCSVLLLAIGVFAVPAGAAPANQASTWVRGTPTLNPENILSARNMGGGQTYLTSDQSLTGPLTITYDGPRPTHLVNTVMWTTPPESITEGASFKLHLNAVAGSAVKDYGGIGVNANWGWTNGLTADVPDKSSTAVCVGGCGQMAASDVNLTMPFGQQSDPQHPENDPTVWVTVDGHTVFFVRYSRSAAIAPPATVMSNYQLIYHGLPQTVFANDMRPFFDAIDAVSDDPTPISAHFQACVAGTASYDTPPAKIRFELDCEVRWLIGLHLSDNPSQPVFPNLGLEYPHISGYLNAGDDQTLVNAAQDIRSTVNYDLGTSY